MAAQKRRRLVPFTYTNTKTCHWRGCKKKVTHEIEFTTSDKPFGLFCMRHAYEEAPMNNIEKLKLLKLDTCHYINIAIRRDGKDEIIEADWLKELQKEVVKLVEQIEFENKLAIKMMKENVSLKEEVRRKDEALRQTLDLFQALQPLPGTVAEKAAIAIEQAINPEKGERG